MRPAAQASPAPLPRPWPALGAACAANEAARVPLWVADAAGHLHHAGAVARTELPLLAALAQPLDTRAASLAPAYNPRPSLQVAADGVILGVPPAQRSSYLALLNQRLQAAGRIRGWRNEAYALPALPADGSAPELPRDTLATLERAAARYWGSATFGAHCNGWVADAQGRPARLWIARRAASKATDPGMLDNLIGGGVPQGQSPIDTIRREGWEEAGLAPAHMAALQPGRVVRVRRDLPEGLQREWLHVYDLRLPPDRLPVNQDGEVAELHCLPVADALACAESGEMTVDAALCCLDFALRHGLLAPACAAVQAAALAPLLCGPSHPPRPGAGTTD